jgi:hypothetical protein
MVLMFFLGLVVNAELCFVLLQFQEVTVSFSGLGTLKLLTVPFLTSIISHVPTVFHTHIVAIASVVWRYISARSLVLDL